MPVERLADVIAATHEAAAEARLEACCWVTQATATCTVVPLRRRRRRCEPAGDGSGGARRRRGLARGTVTGEHGIGLVKSAQLSKQLSPAAVRVHRAVKALFDPKNLLNRGKKVA